MPSDAMRGWDEAFDAWACNEENQAAAAVIERAIAEAVEQERARIVARMRTDAPVPAEIIADAIERGEHKERADG